MTTINKTILFTASMMLLLALWTAGAFFVGKKSVIIPEPRITIDTVVVRETIRDTIPVPQIRYIARIDTVFMSVPGDTVKIEVAVPIERKVYQTDDYRATIEGFRPSLIDMEIYRQTQYVTQTEIQRIPVKKRWGLGIQVGYGYNFDRFYPYVGMGIQYNFLSW